MTTGGGILPMPSSIRCSSYGKNGFDAIPVAHCVIVCEEPHSSTRWADHRHPEWAAIRRCMSDCLVRIVERESRHVKMAQMQQPTSNQTGHQRHG
ncbi:hypothetical protein [Paraburkholderia flagellata]|uniref:hypothetical protein n=1 Tax=Paraburkholderia flagellata TaxID=2883241 RepID=UPI001F403D67|nr:hypothetical protein [Paraburkholderia flagellata]